MKLLPAAWFVAAVVTVVLLVLPLVVVGLAWREARDPARAAARRDETDPGARPAS